MVFESSCDTNIVRLAIADDLVLDWYTPEIGNSHLAIKHPQGHLKLSCRAGDSQGGLFALEGIPDGRYLFHSGEQRAPLWYPADRNIHVSLIAPDASEAHSFSRVGVALQRHDNRLYLLKRDRLQVLDLNGVVFAEYTGLSNPRSMALRKNSVGETLAILPQYVSKNRKVSLPVEINLATRKRGVAFPKGLHAGEKSSNFVTSALAVASAIDPDNFLVIGQTGAMHPKDFKLMRCHSPGRWRQSRTSPMRH